MQIQQDFTINNQSKHELPIHKYKNDIIQMIKTNAVTIICGETGSGKTTQIPQYLFPFFRKILVSQPRRISAITLAERVAEEMHVKIGQEIGYNVRFDEKKCAQTRVTFVTDGMAIRQLMMGLTYDVFILDEAHERSINTDVLMAILKGKLQKSQKQKKGRPFKLVIMSATIDSSKFMKFFNTDSLINIEGRSFPTQIYNLFQPVENYLEAAFNSILQIHYNEEGGDILAFFTGEDEILSLSKRLQKAKEEFSIHNFQILMLYSALPHEYQHSIFTPSSDPSKPRRVILATNIAETSVTIPGVRYVVDTGFMKIRVYDNSKMLDMLTIVPISKANALQRAGRAGRENHGKCYRLFIKNYYDDLTDQTSPQILRSELSGPILQLKAIGIPKITNLQFMDQPPIATINECLALLRELKCLTDQPAEEITEYGMQISKIPLPPKASHLLLSSLDFKCSGLMLSMLSILSIDNLFYTTVFSQKGNKKGNYYQILSKYLPTLHSDQNFNRQGSKTKIFGGQNNRLLTSDHLAKVNILHEYIKSQNKNVFCKQNFINKNNIKRAVLVREQLHDYLQQIIDERSKKSFTSIGSQKQTHKLGLGDLTIEREVISNWMKCMQKGCFYNTAKLNKEGKYLIYKTGQVAHIHPESLCFYLPQKPTIIVFNQIVKTNKVYLKDVTPLQQIY